MSASARSMFESLLFVYDVGRRALRSREFGNGLTKVKVRSRACVCRSWSVKWSSIHLRYREQWPKCRPHCSQRRETLKFMMTSRLTAACASIWTQRTVEILRPDKLKGPPKNHSAEVRSFSLRFQAHTVTHSCQKNKSLVSHRSIPANSQPKTFSLHAGLADVGCIETKIVVDRWECTLTISRVCMCRNATRHKSRSVSIYCVRFTWVSFKRYIQLFFSLVG